jgi:hypothetical protein
MLRRQTNPATHIGSRPDTERFHFPITTPVTTLDRPYSAVS